MSTSQKLSSDQINAIMNIINNPNDTTDIIGIVSGVQAPSLTLGMNLNALPISDPTKFNFIFVYLGSTNKIDNDISVNISYDSSLPRQTGQRINKQISDSDKAKISQILNNPNSTTDLIMDIGNIGVGGNAIMPINLFNAAKTANMSLKNMNIIISYRGTSNTIGGILRLNIFSTEVMPNPVSNVVQNVMATASASTTQECPVCTQQACPVCTQQACEVCQTCPKCQDCPKCPDCPSLSTTAIIIISILGFLLFILLIMYFLKKTPCESHEDKDSE
jgi:hypothetical protein